MSLSSRSRRFAAGLPVILALVSCLAAGPGVSSAAASTTSPEIDPVLDPDLFPVPPSLAPSVRFWHDIFSRYTSDQVVLHHEDYPGIVYTVIDFTNLGASSLSDTAKARKRRQGVEKMEERFGGYLKALAEGRDLEDAREQRRLEHLFARLPGTGGGKYRHARIRFRTQQGLKDVFEQAIRRAGLYLPEIERIFRSHGVPVEITRMAFVESMFQERARSKVAAGGLWQIMPATGRGYLTISREMDLRYDPWTASDAAARILKENHRSLGNWPLAITAYNHGTNGMRRAVARLGTRDIATVIDRYSSRTFGFASKNFYVEFVAAAMVFAERDQHFPGVEPLPQLRFDELPTSDYVSALDLSRGAQVPLAELQALNPGLASDIWREELLIPPGHRLRVPVGRLPAFEQAYLEIPSDRKRDRQLGLEYRVRPGDTLSKIARRFGTSIGALQRINGLRSVHRIGIGQTLLIPGGGSFEKSPHRPVASPSRQPQIHIVRSGETLGAIARRYGVSVTSLKRANGLRGHLIYPRQRLTIP